MNELSPNTNRRREYFSTLLGFVAILLWSSTISLSRILTEQLGSVTSMAIVSSLAGVLGLIYVAGIRRKGAALLHLPRRYLFIGLVLFTLYNIALILAIGLSSSRRQVLEVGLINYLWPSLTLLLEIPILKKRWRLSLIPGIALAVAGIVVAHMSTELDGHFFDFRHTNWLPYLLAAFAAIAWALYSNLTRRWAANAMASGMPLFLLATGLATALLLPAMNEQQHWSPTVVVVLLAAAIGPALLANLFWDTAMRRGRVVLVASVSNFTPLLSTLLSTMLLGVLPGLGLWFACAMIIAAAIICNASVYE